MNEPKEPGGMTVGQLAQQFGVSVGSLAAFADWDDDTCLASDWLSSSSVDWLSARWYTGTPVNP